MALMLYYYEEMWWEEEVQIQVALEREMWEREDLEEAIAQADVRRLKEKIRPNFPRRRGNLGRRTFTDSFDVLSQRLGIKRLRQIPILDEDGEGIIPPSPRKLGD